MGENVTTGSSQAHTATDSFANARCVQGPAALAVSDFTARVELTDVPAGQEIFYRVVISGTRW